MKTDILSYDETIAGLFSRFPSVQNVGFADDAYKPGLERMEQFNGILGNPDKIYKTIHIAGTNGKGSVANMIASAVAACGYKVGLFTSPHITDFRERMRIKDPGDTPARMISREEVMSFIHTYQEDFDRLSLSFFEITTGMALHWFALEKVDWAVIEVGLGGRLDSTNIITPQVSVVTSIGLDHCALLGNTRAEIAGEKAGIFKPGVPAVVGSRDAETSPVFARAAFQHGSSLIYADGEYPAGWPQLSEILPRMDLQGPCQAMNLRTAIVTLNTAGFPYRDTMTDAIAHTAARMDFHGRWERLCTDPETICDIGHNPPALACNFDRLKCLDRPLVIVYGIMADKDLGSIMPLMPADAHYFFCAPATPRAMKASKLYDTCLGYWQSQGRDASALREVDDVHEAIAQALELAKKLASDNAGSQPMVYIGGSTFVVTDAVSYF